MIRSRGKGRQILVPILFWQALVSVQQCSASTADPEVYLAGPTIRHILTSVQRNGTLTAEQSKELMALLEVKSNRVSALVAHVVGESHGEDRELCEALEKHRRYAAADFIRLALLKKSLHGKSTSEKIEAFMPLVEEEGITIISIEAAREILRLDREEGTAVLQTLMVKDEHSTASGEAARLLAKMGVEVDDRLAHANLHADRYVSMIEVIEGDELWPRWRFSSEAAEALQPILTSAREDRKLSETQLAQTLTHFDTRGPYGRLLAAAIYAELKGEYPNMRNNLTQELSNWRPNDFASGLIRFALQRHDLRKKSESDALAWLNALINDPNPYVRAEAAKEITRLNPEDGKALLKRLLESDESKVVRGESARILEKMGEPVPLGAPFIHSFDYRYIRILKIIEGEPLW